MLKNFFRSKKRFLGLKNIFRSKKSKKRIFRSKRVKKFGEAENFWGVKKFGEIWLKKATLGISRRYMD